MNLNSYNQQILQYLLFECFLVKWASHKYLQVNIYIHQVQQNTTQEKGNYIKGLLRGNRILADVA